MAELTDDLINEIIFHLPVKTLLRFRCVSKHFCSVIDSKNFIKKHLTNSVLTKANETLILTCTRKKVYSIEKSSLNRVLELVQPISINRYGTKLIGICNGLLCLLYYCSDFVVIIWNPATRKHVKITVPNFLLSVDEDVLVHGFGYDRVLDDYKVVVLHQFCCHEKRAIRSVSYVYTLGSGSWRKLEDARVEYLVFVKSPGVFACGGIHWVMTELESDSGIESTRVVARGFDLVTEEYRMFGLPDLVIQGETFMSFSELVGCLSYVFRHSFDGLVDVWVMKEYGVVESWTKLLSFSSLDVIRNIDCYVTPLVYSEIGDEVLLLVNSKRLMWYKLKKKTFRFVDIRGLPEYIRVLIYSESLVFLGKKSEADENQGVGAKAKQKNMFLSVGFKLVL